MIYQYHVIIRTATGNIFVYDTVDTISKVTDAVATCLRQGYDVQVDRFKAKVDMS